VKPFRSPKYLAWIRSQPCILCHRPAIDASNAHHEPLGENYVGGKPPDTHALPMCVRCHYERHQYGVGGVYLHIDPKLEIIRHITRYLGEGGKF
jgi:hypothetical protein